MAFIFIGGFNYIYIIQINLLQIFFYQSQGGKSSFAEYLKSNLSIFPPDTSFHIEQVSLRQLGLLHVILAYPVLPENGCFQEGPSRTEL